MNIIIKMDKILGNGKAKASNEFIPIGGQTSPI